MKSTEMLSPRARVLGAALHDARMAARFGVRELARRLGRAPGYLSNWESGSRVPAVEDVGAVLGALGVTGEAKERILAIARGVVAPDWFTAGPQSSPGHFAALVAHERAAASVTVWAPVVLPDLLQIPDYAQLTCDAKQFSAEQIGEQVEARMRRRSVLFGRDAVPAEFFIGDEAIRHPLADEEVMLRQLRFIVDTATMSRSIGVRILRRSDPRSAVLAGAFATFTMNDAPPVAYCSHYNMGAFLVNGPAGAYTRAAARLGRTALSRGESIDWLNQEVRRLARSLESQRDLDDVTPLAVLAGEVTS
ncbi:helix-turn-helix transcriptional regulator [Amycolatopsis sp. PS_44_ISF1]|uniref:helix-turn-helix domain-containing protein n=1 Tax=Amycolatopsis sp. PS_44_ISF1 TaxID=2974917 RepID=UPI0028E05054|nr:helix-turn-helix transcriptional regulator [Amycolatopsis sp. PS_44_ISF1]MDT8911485.1 helix-turn-helix transcriptional regulator [Amycolatopsis sp. PS_44_ISF1]